MIYRYDKKTIDEIFDEIESIRCDMEFHDNCEEVYNRLEEIEKLLKDHE